MTSQLLNPPARNPLQNQTSLFFHKAAGGPEAQQAFLAEMHAALTLSASDRRRAAYDRLLGWIELGELAGPLADAYNHALEMLESDSREVIIDAEQDAALHALTRAEYDQVSSLLPWLRVADESRNTDASGRPNPMALLVTTLSVASPRTIGIPGGE